MSLLSNIDLKYLPTTKLAGSATVHEQEIIGDAGAVNHVVTLSSQGKVISRNQEAELTPTHVLVEADALPIGSSFELPGFSVDGSADITNPYARIVRRGTEVLLDNGQNDSGAAIALNGQPAPASAALHKGDQITVGDQTLTLISVRQNG